MSKTWRAGVIGAGAIAVHGHIPGYQSVPDVELIALCDINQERAKSVAASKGIAHIYGDYREMLDKEE